MLKISLVSLVTCALLCVSIISNLFHIISNLFRLIYLVCAKAFQLNSIGSSFHLYDWNTSAAWLLVITCVYVQIPKKGKIYSVNEGNAKNWDGPTAKYVGLNIAIFYFLLSFHPLDILQQQVCWKMQVP